MSVSGNTQQGMYGNHFDEQFFVVTQTECDDLKAELRSTGLYSKVSSTRWNNGSRANPRFEHKVMVWRKR